MKLLITSIIGLFMMAGCASNQSKTASAGAPSCNSAAEKASGKAAAIPAEGTHTTPGKGSTCTKGSDVRGLKAEAVAPTGCKTTYSVNGAERVIASAVNDASYCEKKVEKVKGNLSAVGYTCD